MHPLTNLLGSPISFFSGTTTYLPFSQTFFSQLFLYTKSGTTNNILCVAILNTVV